MKITFSIVKRVRPVTLKEYIDAPKPWLRCQIKITKSSQKKWLGRFVYFQGSLPSCAPYLHYTVKVKQLEKYHSPTFVALDETQAVECELINQSILTKQTKNFLVEEVVANLPPDSTLTLAEIRARILPHKYALDLKKDDLVVNFCVMFRYSYEQCVLVGFPKQRTKIGKLSLEDLKKCLEYFKTKPWLLMFASHSRSEFGLKEMSLPNCNRVREVYRIGGAPEIRTAMRLYSFVKGIRKQSGHTMFTKATITPDFLRKWPYDRRHVEAAYAYLEKKAIMFVDATKSTFAVLGDLNTAEVICHALLRIQNSTKMPEERTESDRPCHTKGELNERQSKASVMIACNWFTVVIGGPGNGKSEVIVDVVSTLKKVLVVTYVGRAVEMLRDRLNGYQHVYTIHYVYYRARYDKTPAWINQFDTVILDEGSNIDSGLLSKFLAVLSKDLCRLVLVGDVFQIDPIKPGNPFRDMIDTFSDCVVELTQNMRVDMDSRALAAAAVHIRENQLDQIDFNQNCLRLVPRDRQGIKAFVNTYFARHANSVMDVEILCLRKDVTGEVNNVVEKWLLDREFLRNTSKGPPLRKNFYLYPGKKIMFTQNVKANPKYKTEGVCNGELGQVLSTERVNDVTILTLLGSKKRIAIGYGRDLVPPFQVQLGYAMTCNKSQGSEWRHIIFYLHEGISEFWTRAFLYVAESRAKKSCLIVGTSEELKEMCARRAIPRRTIFSHVLQTTMIDSTHSDIEDWYSSDETEESW